MRIKILKIYLPFLIFSLGFFGLYTFLHWLIIIKLDLFHPKEMIVNFLIPVLITIIAVLFYFQKRIDLLKLGPRGDRLYIFFCMISFFIPVIIGQEYLENKSGKLCEIENPSLINFNKQALFYSISKANTLNRSCGLWVKRTNADRNGSEILITCYFACPLVDPNLEDDQFPKKIKAWIGVAFSKKFSNRAVDDKNEQKIEIKRFINSCIDKHEYYNYQTNYLRNLRNSDQRDDYLAAIELTNIQANKKELLILREEKGSYDTRTGNGPKWILGIIVSSNLIWFLFVFFPSVNKTELRKFGTIKEKEKRKREFREILMLFYPSRNYWATPTLIDLNFLIYLFMILSGVGIINPQVNELIKWGAIFKPLIADGQWWRLITSMFLHSGFVHLANNLFALFLVGLFLETSIGSSRFMIVYLMTGAIASLASLYFHDSSVSLGASGAIFGMYGLLAALIILKYLDKNLSAMLGVSVVIFIGLNLILGLNGGIDMPAHLGGLFSGFLIGVTYFPLSKYIKSKHKKKALPKRTHPAQTTSDAVSKFG
jgi:rhomboid protease GluP